MEERRKVLFGGINLLLAILLILLAIFLYTGLSTGWFAKNEEVTATGMNASIEGIHISDVSAPVITVDRATKPNPNGVEDKDNLLPGDVITVTAEFQVLPQKGNTTALIPVEFFLRTPPDQTDGAGKITRDSDLPVILTDGKGNKTFYYLSSQIYVQKAELLEKTGNSYVSQKVLLDNSAVTEEAKQIWLMDHELEKKTAAADAIPDIPLGRQKPQIAQKPNQVFQLQPNKYYQMKLTLVFYNDPVKNQSPLRGAYENKTPEQVIPSSFWREIVVNEIY